MLTEQAYQTACQQDKVLQRLKTKHTDYLAAERLRTVDVAEKLNLMRAQRTAAGIELGKQANAVRSLDKRIRKAQLAVAFNARGERLIIRAISQRQLAMRRKIERQTVRDAARQAQIAFRKAHRISKQGLDPNRS